MSQDNNGAGVMSSASSLAFPIISDEYKFQELCRDLWKRRFPDAEVKEYARRGQAQDGIDVTIIDHKKTLTIGIQCKATSDPDTALTEGEIRECVKLAKAFTPALSQFKIATTRKTDKGTQDFANKLSAELVQQGSFTIEVVSWNELMSDLKFYRELIEIYFPQFDWSALAKEQEGQLEQASALLERYRVQDATLLIDSMRSRAWAVSEPKIKARILTIEANCKFILGQDVDGARLLREAYQLDSHNETRLCNYAHACVVEGKSDQATEVLERVLKSNPNNEQAYAIAVGIWAATSSLDEVISRVPPDLHSSYRVASSIGGIARASGEIEVALKWYEKATQSASPKVIGDIWATLGELYLHSILLNRQFAANEVPTSDEKLRLMNAVKHLTEAISCVEDQTVFGNRHQWLFNCSVAHAILGDFDQAIERVTQALKFDNKNQLYLSHRAKLEFQRKGNSAKSYLDQIPEAERESSDWALLYSESLRKENRRKEAEQVIRNFLSNSSEPLLRREAYRLLFSLLLDQKKFTLATEILEEPEIRDLGEVSNKLMKGQLHLLMGKKEEARTEALELTNLASDKFSFVQLRELGKLLREVDEYKLASQQFQKLQTLSHDKSVRLMVLENLYLAGDHADALALSLSILATDGPSRFVSELATTLCQVTGDLETGLTTCEEYLRLFPEDGLMKVHKAIILFRQRKTEATKAFLDDEINLKDLPPKGWLNLARLHNALGNYMQALELSYEARRSFFNNSEIHNTLISAYFVCSQQAGLLPQPEIVQGNCAVQLRTRETVFKWIVIEEREDLKPELFEYAHDHPAVRAIWGHKCGDVVPLTLGTVEPEDFQIVQICSKYVFAAYESMERFAELFPNDSGPLKVMVPRADSEAGNIELNPIFGLVAAQAERARYCLDLYKSGLITVGALATMVNRHLTDIILSLVHGQGVSLYACLGNVEEAQQQLELLQTSPTGLVFDLTSVASLVRYGIAEQVGELVKDRAVVTQSTLDVLQAEIGFSSSTREKGYKVLSVSEGLPSLDEISKEQVAASSKFLGDIDAWFRKFARIDNSGMELKLPWEEKNQLNGILGACFVDSLLVATQPKYLLISDDSQLRILGKNEFGVQGLWTGSLLVDLHRQGYLTIEQVDDSLIEAICSGYRHVPISPQLLIRAVSKSGWNLDNRSQLVIDSLKDPSWPITILVNLAAQFIVKLWIESIPAHRRDALVFALLGAISDNRDAEVLSILLRRQMPQYLRLLPFYKSEILELIGRWADIKRNR